MKKYDLIKTIQLVVYVVLAILCIRRFPMNSSFLKASMENPDLKVLSIFLWISMGLSFVFLFIDFTMHAHQKKDYANLRNAVHSDALSSIANRNSCDALIAKYTDTTLPDNFCCVMLELANIRQINTEYGRTLGNKAIQDFSVIVQMSSVAHGFVGRNGGNKYLALFENGSEGANAFLERTQQKINEYNSNDNRPDLAFVYGISETADLDKKEIHALIACADRRLNEQLIMENDH